MSVLKNTVQKPFFFVLLDEVSAVMTNQKEEKMSELGSTELILESDTGPPVLPMTHIK